MLPLHDEAHPGIRHDGQVEAQLVVLLAAGNRDDTLAMHAELPAAGDRLDAEVLELGVLEIGSDELGDGTQAGVEAALRIPVVVLTEERQVVLGVEEAVLGDGVRLRLPARIPFRDVVEGRMTGVERLAATGRHHRHHLVAHPREELRRAREEPRDRDVAAHEPSDGLVRARRVLDQIVRDRREDALRVGHHLAPPDASIVVTSRDLARAR